MGSRQVTKMITAEAATYAICGTTVGIILGLLLHYLIYAKIVITHRRLVPEYMLFLNGVFRCPY